MRSFKYKLRGEKLWKLSHGISKVLPYQIKIVQIGEGEKLIMNKIEEQEILNLEFLLKDFQLKIDDKLANEEEITKVIKYIKNVRKINEFQSENQLFKIRKLQL